MLLHFVCFNLGVYQRVDILGELGDAHRTLIALALNAYRYLALGRYDTMIYSQLVFDVTIDGKVYTIKDDIRGNYVLHIANSIVANPSESEAVKEYAEQLISTYEAAKQN